MYPAYPLDSFGNIKQISAWGHAPRQQWHSGDSGAAFSRSDAQSARGIGDVFGQTPVLRIVHEMGEESRGFDVDGWTQP